MRLPPAAADSPYPLPSPPCSAGNNEQADNDGRRGGCGHQRRRFGPFKRSIGAQTRTTGGRTLRQRGRPGSPWPETMLYRNARRGQHTGNGSPHLVGVLRVTETPCVNGLQGLVANKLTEMGRRGLLRSGSVFVFVTASQLWALGRTRCSLKHHYIARSLKKARV